MITAAATAVNTMNRIAIHIAVRSRFTGAGANCSVPTIFWPHTLASWSTRSGTS